MKRKLISQKDSFTITLPKNWIRSKNISAGDEITLNESKGLLILSTSQKESKKEFHIEVSDYSETHIRNILNQLYILNATRITITSKSKAKLLICKKLCSLFLVGFEVTKEDKNKLILELLATPSEDSLDKFLLKIFNFLEYNLMILKEGKKNLSEIKRSTKKITQFKNISKRIILSNLMNDSKKIFLSEIVSYLTEINHLIFHIAERNVKITKKEIELIGTTFNLIKKGFYKENEEVLNEVQQNVIKFENNPFVFAIIRNLYNLSNSVAALNQNPEKSEKIT